MQNKITGRYKVCAVIGDPITHSLSPTIHNTMTKYYAHEMVYVPFHVVPDGLEEAIKGAHALGIQGLNVTMPHKQTVMPLLTHIDEVARKVCAVNTLVYEDKGYKGYNTDVYGLEASMRDGGIEYKGKNVAIIGSGGAAYAAVECVIGKAQSVHIFNRTLENAKNLKEHFEKYYDTPIFIYEMNEEVPCVMELVIQTTGIGMGAYKEIMPACSERLLEHAEYAVDLIYNPWETVFLKAAKEAGCKCINGFDMLFYQAVQAYELMNKCNCDEETINQIKEEINALVMR